MAPMGTGRLRDERIGRILVGARSLPLRNQLPEIAAAESIDQIRNAALQRDRETNDGRETRHLQTALHVADVGVRHAGQFGERSDAHAALLTQLPQARAEHFCFSLYTARHETRSVLFGRLFSVTLWRIARRRSNVIDSDLITRIRHIFLHQRPHVSLMTAANDLGWTLKEMRAAVARGEIRVMRTKLGTWVWRDELVAKALEIWPLDVIEDALGDDAPRVMPEAVRTAELRARVPRYQVAMLEHMAGREATTVSAILTRELDDVASANAEELFAAIPGFRAAFEWPEGITSEQSC